ncbi:DUF3558 domain-containing protein, partial [Mycobacterium tuberculosis]
MYTPGKGPPRAGGVVFTRVRLIGGLGALTA